MRVSIRSAFVTVFVVLVLLFAGLMFVAVQIGGGLRVSVVDNTVIIHNSGALVRGATIVVSGKRGTQTLNAAILPPGQTTLSLHAPIEPKSYEGATLEGSRLGVSWTWHFASDSESLQPVSHQLGPAAPAAAPN